MRRASHGLVTFAIASACSAPDTNLHEDAGIVDASDSGRAPCLVPPSEFGLGEYLSSKYGLEFLAKMQVWPRTVAVLQGRLYWDEYFVGRVHSSDLDGCAGTVVTDNMSLATSLTSDGESVFWLAGPNSEIVRYHPGSGATQIGTAEIGFGLAVTESDVYGVTSQPCSLVAIPKVGGAARIVSPVFQGAGTLVHGWGNRILFVCGSPTAMYSYDTASGATKKLVERSGQVFIVSLTTTATSIVWGEDACADFFAACPFGIEDRCCGGRVMELDMSTGVTSTIASDPVSRPFAVGVDRRWLYWSNLNAIQRRDRLATTTETVAEHQASVASLVFVGEYVYWANSYAFGDLVEAKGALIRAPRR